MPKLSRKRLYIFQLATNSAGNLCHINVLSTCLGRKPEEIIKLDANKNPYGPPPKTELQIGSHCFRHKKNFYQVLQARKMQHSARSNLGNLDPVEEEGPLEQDVRSFKIPRQSPKGTTFDSGGEGVAFKYMTLNLL